MTQRLTPVWEENIKTAIGKYAGPEALSCIANTTLRVTNDPEIVPEGNGKNEIRIPLLYIQFQISAVQAPAFFILGVPEAENMSRVFAMQEVIFRELNEAVLNTFSDRHATIRVESVFARLGMSVDRYGEINKELKQSKDNFIIGDIFGSAFQFIILHEAAHIIDKCINIDKFTSAQNPELRADDFALAIMVKEDFPLIIAVEPLRTVIAFEGRRSAGMLASCRLARAVFKIAPASVTFLTNMNISTLNASTYSKRIDALSAFMKNRYSIDNCAPYE